MTLIDGSFRQYLLLDEEYQGRIKMATKIKRFIVRLTWDDFRDDKTYSYERAEKLILEKFDLWKYKFDQIISINLERVISGGDDTILDLDLNPRSVQMTVLYDDGEIR